MQIGERIDRRLKRFELILILGHHGDHLFLYTIHLPSSRGRVIAAPDSRSEQLEMRGLCNVCR